MTKPTFTPAETKPTSEKTRSKISLQTIVASVFLNSGNPVIEHILHQSRPAAIYGKLDQVK